MNSSLENRHNIMTATGKIWISLLALAFLMCSVCAFGQTEAGQITGTITDTSGAVVKDAKVAAKSVNTGQTREATSNGSGIYTIPGLRADTYEVTVELAGFQKISKQVSLAVGSTVDVSLQLTVGAETTVVEVTASNEGTQVNTTNQTLSQVITSAEIDMLPTSPTRNPYNLVGTSGNVTEDNSSVRGAGYAINGSRSASTSILLDGTDNVDLYRAQVGQAVPLDSVQEFSVLTSGFTAEYGRAGGGVVNLVTKSGSNQFHGSGYEYNRVSALSANTYQNDATAQKKGTFTRNNFGFAVGGPVIKNKLFFFSNTEWVRVRSSAPTAYNIIDPSSIPLLAPASQAYFKAAGQLASIARVTGSGPCGTLTCDAVNVNTPSDAGGGTPQNTWEEVARVDYNLSDRTTIFGRYASYKENDFPGSVNASPYNGYNTGQTNYDQNFELNISHVFSASLLNTTKIAFNRLNGPNQPLSTAPVSPTLYTTGTVPTITVAGVNAQLVFPGYNETAPGLGLPAGGPQNLYQIYDDLSWTKGKHQFKFGGQFFNQKDNRTFGAYENPVEVLSSSNVNNALANLALGQIYNFQGAISPQGKFPCVRNATTGAPIPTAACTLTLPVGPPAFGRNYRYNDGAVYGEDSWKVMPRLTLDLGLRWEYYGVQHNANPALDSNFVLGSGSTFFNQIRNGNVQLASNGGVFWKPNYHNFGPRLGFAWDIFGDGSTSLRGGYGISYERNFGNVTFNAIQNPPNYAVISLISAAANGGAGDVPFMPVYSDPAGPLAGSGTTKSFPPVSQRAINQNIKTASTEIWNLSVDRRVGKGVFSAAYAGSHGLHLYDIANVNPGAGGNGGFGGGGLFLGDARASNRINYQYSNMNYRSDGGYSHYDALNLKYGATNLLNKGLAVTANYTWSHALDNLSSTFSDSNGATASGAYQLGYLDAFNPQLNYGNADFDVRNRLNASLAWESPYLKNSSNAIARNALGGWGLGTVFSIRSGSPFSIYDCNNASQTACPLWIAPSPVATSGSASGPVSPNLFNYIALPNTAGTVDNQGISLGLPNCAALYHVGCTYTTNGQPYPERNQYVGPGYWNIDMNFYKTFKLTERFGLQFRAELYNILNHHNQYVQTENIDVSGLATPFIQSAKGEIYGISGQPSDERRNIQFGLKLTF